MAIKDGILAEYDHEMGTTRKLLERLPDDKLAWKPHLKSMSLGGLATHLSNLPNWGATILTDLSFDLADAPPNLDALTTRADILTAFDGSRNARAPCWTRPTPSCWRPGPSGAEGRKSSRYRALRRSGPSSSITWCTTGVS